MNAAPASCFVMTIWAGVPTVAVNRGNDSAADHAEDVPHAGVGEGVDQVLGDLALRRRPAEVLSPTILGSETVFIGASPMT